MLEDLPGGENAQWLFKRRMMSCILATDMSKHMTDLIKLKNFINGLKDGQSILDTEEIDSVTPEEQVFQNQQRFLDSIVHACDISFLARTVSAQQIWIDTLFEGEFFMQGDLEKEQGIKVSFLCDRSIVNPVNEQKGFAQFAPIPLFKILTA